MRWTTRLAIAAGAVVVRLLAHTWRLRTIHGERVRDMRRDHKPIIFMLWHGHLLVGLWQHRSEGVQILISEHRDGEIIARIGQSLGYGAVRGSTSRGGARSLLELARRLSSGADVAITPDGPRGPARTVAPGALVAAQRSGAGMIAVGVHASRAWRLRSWDRFLIPKPFARVTVAYRGPLYVSDGGAREAAARGDEVAALIDGAIEDAGG